jgi:hypothetical protein
LLLQELKASATAGAAYALTWYARLSSYIEGGGTAQEKASKLLALMKDAVLGGQASPQWGAAKVRVYHDNTANMIVMPIHAQW